MRGLSVTQATLTRYTDWLGRTESARYKVMSSLRRTTRPPSLGTAHRTEITVTVDATDVCSYQGGRAGTDAAVRTRRGGAWRLFLRIHKGGGVRAPDLNSKKKNCPRHQRCKMFPDSPGPFQKGNKNATHKKRVVYTNVCIDNH